MDDISARALSILRSVAAIAAEDTRHSRYLLQQANITTPLFSLHEYNERDIAERMVERLLSGDSLALISDAGTPLVSDPGYHVVKAAQDAGLRVSPIPGPCALIAALSVAGLPTDRFIFAGFLSAKTTARQQQLQRLVKEPYTLIFYEAPHRILDLIPDLLTVFGPEREMVIARELTKTFETVHRCTIAEMQSWLTHDPHQQKGEFVVMLKGYEATVDEIESQEQMLAILDILIGEKLPLKQAVAICAKITGFSKNKLYDMALERYAS